MPLRRRAAAAGALVSAVLAFTVFRPPPTPGPLVRDFEAYYAAGATLNAGGDPYSRAIWSVERTIPGVERTRDELLPFVGPAAGLPLWSLFARLPYIAAATLWIALLLGAAALIAGAALRLARAPRDPWLIFCAAAMTLTSAPVLGSLALGQAALLSAAGIAGAAVAYRSRKPGAAGAATLVGALQPNLALALAGRVRSRWDLGVAASATAVFALLTLTAGGGFSGATAYLAHLREHGAAERDVAIQYTPSAIAYAFGLPLPALAAFGGLAALAAVVAAVVIVVRERLDATTSTLVVAALLPLAAPFFHEHDFALEVLPILVLTLRAAGRARVLAAVGAMLVLVDWFGLAQRPGAQAQVLCLGLTVALAAAGMKRTSARLRRADFAAPAVLAAVAFVALPLALFRPAPTWPDMLPAAFHADGRADAAGIWAAEQRAAGLTRREPVWGLLRMLPLGGCIALTAGLVLDARRRRRVPTVRGDVRFSARAPVKREAAARRAHIDV